MNYYPNNFYSNYPYSNTYQQPQTQPSLNMLQGKLVDSEEMVRVTEVPFGGYGVFPKADFSEIYIKTWNNNGTTQINVYRPVAIEPKEEVDTNALILAKIADIETKLDSIVNKPQEQIKSKTTSISDKKKELNVSAY